MKKLKVFLIAVLLATGLSAQNLVTNGNFSVKATNSPCLLGTGFNKGQPDGWWDGSTKYGTIPYAETPDYYHTCSPVGIRHPSNNSRGCADPKVGTAYVGLLAWSKNHPHVSAEYIYQELASPLIKNQPYYIEFWVSAADDPEFNYSVASLGMYLTNNVNDFNAGQGPGYHSIAPSVQIPNTFPGANYYTTTNGWQKISGTYTPTVDNVKHILIGNFDPGIAAFDPDTNPNSPNIQHRPGANSGDQEGDGQTAYYFIDGVYIARAIFGEPNLEPIVNGPNAVCTSNTTYTLSNYNTLASVTWQATPSSRFTNSSGSGASATLKASNAWVSGNSTLTFTINGVCDTETVEKTIWLGKPASVTTNPSGVPAIQASVGNWIDILATTTTGSSIYVLNWWTNNSAALDLIVSSGNCTVECRQTGYNYVYVTASNSCGTSPPRQIPFNVASGGGGGMFQMSMVYSPNPVRDVLNVSISNKDTKSSTNSAKSKFDLVLVNNQNTVVFKERTSKENISINVSHLPKGIYYLRLCSNI